VGWKNVKIDITRACLAVNGGRLVRTAPWLDNFTFGEEEKRAAVAAIETGYLSKFEGSHTPDPPFSFHGGPYVQRLEQMWSECYGVKYCVSVNSATSGLFAAIGALEIGYGDEVIVSPSTMSASSVGPLVYGAIPVFADVERKTGAIDPVSFEKAITPRTRCIIIVHQFGIPADMDAIMSIARRHGIKVIEDCAQAHGAKYKGRFVGTFGDIGVFSLNVNKAIQCGEGGVCTTNDDELKYRLGLIRNHGENVVGPADYKNIVNIIGFNYRLTEIQAAIAIEQLKKMEAINNARIGYVHSLNESLGKLDFLDVIEGREECLSTFYTYPIIFRPEIAGIDVETFRTTLNAEGMYFIRGYKPLYQQPIYQTRLAFKAGYPFSAPENQGNSANYQPGVCPVAESLRECLLINEYIRLPNTQSDLDDIVRAFGKLASG
jgi:dTDP-4-amino-4,6-dideoxygalactose transaminase